KKVLLLMAINTELEMTSLKITPQTYIYRLEFLTSQYQKKK
ncbi:hypothetical protein DDB_G0286903, partial [Dictyostelium discoideum AX4]